MRPKITAETVKMAVEGNADELNKQLGILFDELERKIESRARRVNIGVLDRTPLNREGAPGDVLFARKGANKYLYIKDADNKWIETAL